MKNFTIFQLVLLCLITNRFQVFSQCNALVCNTSLTVVVNDHCEIKLNRNDLLDTLASDCPVTLTITASINGNQIGAAQDSLLLAGNNYIDQILNVVVEEIGGGMSCQVAVTVIDDLAPSIICPSDFNVCVDQVPSSYSAYGLATASDNCSGTSISVSDSLMTDTTFSQVFRTFVASDDYGNKDSCLQVLTFHLNPDLIVPPFIEICLGDTLNLDSIGLIDQHNTNGVLTYHSGTPANALNQLDTSLVSPSVDTFFFIKSTTAEGCFSEIQINIEIASAQVLSCSDAVQVSLDQNCLAVLTPDMILEGDYYYPLYQVDITNGLGESMGDTVDIENIGQTLIVKVTDQCFNNSCWGSISVEDKLGPVIQCGAPITIGCLDELEDAQVPIAIDNCEGEVPVLLTGENVIENDLCDNDTILVERTWLAFDSYLNQSLPCKDTVIISSNLGVNFPEDLSFSCMEYAADPLVIDASYNMPEGLNSSQNMCNVSITFEEEIVPICGNMATNFKIIRTWLVLDWCTGQIITEGANGNDNIQNVIVEDSYAPEITAEDLVVGTTIPATCPSVCRSTDFIPSPLVGDDCNDWDLRIFTPIGELEYANGINGNEGGNIPYPGLPVGNYPIQYQAEDACGNVNIFEINLSVADNTAPIIMCKDEVDVTINNDGAIPILASFFAWDAYDDCCIDQILVSKTGEDGTYTPFVDFSCEDAAVNGLQVHVMALDWAGLSSTCTTPILISFGFAPTITCPDDVTINSEDYANHFEIPLSMGDYSVLDSFGLVSVGENCGNVPSDVQTVNLMIDQCKSGDIIRTFEIISNQGADTVSCNQTISVEHVSNLEVQFPENGMISCEEELPDFGTPDIFCEYCDMIAVSYDDEIFNSNNGACFKIVRNWTIINWCNATSDFEDTMDDPLIDILTYADGGDGVILAQQTIEVNDDQAPVILSDCDDITTSLGENCDAKVILPPIEVADDCGVEPDVNFITDMGNGDGPFDGVAPGTYDVLVIASDNCGNVTTCDYQVFVFDDKNPTPYCVDGLVVEISNDNPPTVELWASDFDAGSFDDCSPQISLGFDELGTSSQVFTCDDIGALPIELWVTDEGGNQDYCSTFVIIQDNMGHCEDNLVQLNGSMETEAGNPVSGVDVNLNGGMSDFMTTNETGTFNFEIEEGADVTISPYKNDEPLNGVTTFDLVLISKHVLGTQLFDSPYKIIAADANNSGSVTTLDLVMLRRLILNINDSFTNNTSWRFVEKDYVFPNPMNPWQGTFPEVVNLNNVPAGGAQADFVSIKTGDVNGSAQTNNLQSADDRDFNKVLSLHLNESKLKAGETYQLDFNTGDIGLYGFQFTLEFDAELLTYKGFEPAILQSENLAFQKSDEGFINVSWHDANIHQFEKGQVLFSLTFEAQSNHDLEHAIWIGSSYTKAEAYSEKEELMDLQLVFDSTDEMAFQMWQNAPNPFSNFTKIKFHAPENQEVEISVFDSKGQLIKQINNHYSIGFHEIHITNNDLKIPGVYYYQVKTNSKKQTSKMVFIQ